MADKSVDPRFDPRFQRGYSGPASSPSGSSSRTKPIVVKQVQPRSVDIPYPTPEQAADPRVAPPALVPADEAPRRNPFSLALLLGSIAAIVGSVATYVAWLKESNRGFSFSPGTDPADYVWFTLGNLAPAPLLLGGLLGLITWIVLKALMPRRVTDSV
jgi:hypothetical protein